MSTSTVDETSAPQDPPTVPVTAASARPAPVGSGPSDPAGSTGSDEDRDRSKLAVILVLVAALVVGLLAALVLSRSHPQHAAAAQVGSADASTTISVGITATSIVNPDQSPIGSVVSSHPTPTAAPVSTAAPTTTASTAVAFTSASASPSSVSCPDPDASTTTTAFVQPTVHLTWTAVHATSVDLSVDGPGVYQAGLPASGSYDFSFGCNGPHTLLLTAHGAGGTTAARTFVITSHE